MSDSKYVFGRKVNRNTDTLDNDLPSDAGIAPTSLPTAPRLVIFDPDRGASTVPLKPGDTLIGRGMGADIMLSDSRISRLHATIRNADGRCSILDAESKSGTLVNNRPVHESPLLSGDTIQIRDFVLQYRDDLDAPDEEAGSLTPVQKAFRETYSYLPDAMTLRYREIAVDPAKVFAKGDTVIVREGGILLPVKVVPEGRHWILDIEIEWPDGQKRQFFGECLSRLPSGALCVKLHAHPKDGPPPPWFETARRSSWVKSVPPKHK